MRTTMLPMVIKFLQKMWRGAIARQRYKIFYAMFKIVRKFRAWKFKIYLLTLIRRFSGVREMSDFGKSLEWPQAPFILRKFHIKLYNTFRRWRLRQRLKSITTEEWPEIKCKIAALDVIGNKRDLSLNRRWDGNYLADVKENLHASVYSNVVNNLLTKNHAGSPLFSSFIKKLSSRGKTVDRAIVFTEFSVFKLDPKRDFKLLKTLELEEVSEIVVTTGDDQLVVLRTTDGYEIAITLENNNNENRVPELLGALRLNAKIQYRKKMLPHLEHTSAVGVHLPESEDDTVKFTVQPPPIVCMINSSSYTIDVEVLESKAKSIEEWKQDGEHHGTMDPRFRKESGSRKIVMEYKTPPARKVAAVLANKNMGKINENAEAGKNGGKKQDNISLDDKKKSVIKIEQISTEESDKKAHESTKL